MHACVDLGIPTLCLVGFWFTKSLFIHLFQYTSDINTNSVREYLSAFMRPQ